nr:reverse transcriptase domain-containing protein [Tanacetum cinerariifolium]
MRTHSSSNLVGESSSNPTSSNSKRRNRAAHRWLEKEPPHSILTWEDLVSKFINEFFHPSRTTNLRNEIFNFQQRFDESFHEAWDRYKDLLRACPHHGFTELRQLDTFYNALNPADQDSLNSATGGNLLERRTQYVLTISKTNPRGKERMSMMLSSDATFSMEMFLFGHCPKEMVTYLRCVSYAKIIIVVIIIKIIIKKKTNEDRDDELDNVQTNGGGSENSRGNRLAISMVEEVWLSEKEERERMFSLKKKNVLSKRKNVFVEEKECIVEEKECFRRRE